MDQYVLGIDCGTQGVRVGLFDLAGRQIGLSIRSYDVIFDRYNWAEQNPKEVLQALMDAVRELVSKYDQIIDNIIALGIDATAVTLVASDQAGNPLHNAILWMDKRAQSESEAINRTRYQGLVFTGGSVSPEWALPKIMWLKKNCPGIYKQAAYLVDMVDWLIFRLTGVWSASLCNLITEWTYVPEGDGWDKGFLAELGIGDLIQKVPLVRSAMGQVVGRLQDKPASFMHLKAGLPVVTAGMDSYAAGVGLGVTQNGRMTFSLGTSSCYLMQCTEPVKSQGLFGPMPGPIEADKWVLQGGQTSAASIIKWYRENLVTFEDIAEANHAQMSVYSWLDKQVKELPAGSDYLLALDSWHGNRTPLRDPLFTGAIWGLTLNHTRWHIYRALLESVAYGGRMILEAFRKADMNPDEIYVCGGGAVSDVWLQIHADVFGLPVVRTEVQQAASLGAAMCAAVGVGAYQDLTDAYFNMVRVQRVFNPCLSQVYDRFFKLYKQSYTDMSNIMHNLYKLKSE